MSYLTQMVGLAVQNFVSAASGMAVLVALIRGFARRTTSHHRQLLGRPDPRHALHPAAALARPRARPRLAGRGADLRGVQEGRARPAGDGERAEARRRRRPGQGRAGQPGHRDGHRDRADARARPGRLADRDQAARHERRRLLQRQLGAPVREPDAALRTSSSCSRSSCIPAALCLHVRRDGAATRRQGWAMLAAMVVDLRAASRSSASSQRAGRQPAARAARRRPARVAPRRPAATWKARRSASGSVASALWATATTAASNGSVNSMHDSFTPLGGLVPLCAHAARRGHLRRRRLRALRHADRSPSSRSSSPA